MSPVALEHATVIDGRGRLLPDTTVVVSGAVITHAGPSGATAFDRRATGTLDARGLWLMPGLINCHDHLFDKRLRDVPPGGSDRDFRLQLLQRPPGQHAVESAHNATWQLRQGVTTVRDLGGPSIDADQSAPYTNVDLRDAIAAGSTGPRVLASRLMVTMTGGHGTPWFGVREADGPGAVRAAVREQLKGGADCIKIMSSGGLANYPHESPGIDQYTIEELRAGAEEAHNAGRLITTHAMSDRSVRNALNAGIDNIDHGFFIKAETVKRMAAEGRSFVPTARVAWRVARAGTGALGQLMAEAAPHHRDRILEAHEVGVPVGVGTDSRFTMLEEMETLREYGMASMDVLVGATGVAAKICGLEGVGVIEPGAAADLLLLGQNPLDDLRAAFADIRLVMKAGETLVSSTDPDAPLRPLAPPPPV